MFFRLQSLLNKAQHHGQALVQVRVLQTQGSTYRKAGARMLFDEQGQQFDLVSGGCLETHLSRHASQVISHGKPKLLEYDFSDPDAAHWQISVGCRGKVTLLLEKLTLDNNYASLALFLQGRQSTQPSWLTTDLTTGASQFHMDSPNIEVGSTKNSAANIVEVIYPAPRLLLIGTGADADAIVNLARDLDFLVQVIGCQSQSLQAFQHRFPKLASHIPASQLNSYLAKHPADYIIVMTHNQALDAQYLSQTGITTARLVGLLGPSDRKQRVIIEMTCPPPENLVAPVGLDLGGHGAQAVALSIMAQIQAHYHRMQAQPLNIKQGGIHDSP